MIPESVCITSITSVVVCCIHPQHSIQKQISPNELANFCFIKSMHQMYWHWPGKLEASILYDSSLPFNFICKRSKSTLGIRPTSRTSYELSHISYVVSVHISSPYTSSLIHPPTLLCLILLPIHKHTHIFY